MRLSLLFKLKLAFALEIGAVNGYIGHYNRTKDSKYMKMAQEEANHAAFIDSTLEFAGHDTSIILDNIIGYMGQVLGLACRFAPLFLMDRVASIIEKINARLYYSIAKDFPGMRHNFIQMAKNEEKHSRMLSFKLIKSPPTRRLGTH